MKENHTLSSFIRAPYELNCNDDVPDTVKRYYGHKCYSENASNLIKLRTKKYRNWLDLENWWDPLPIPIYVNYENVLKNPELTIKELFYKYKFKEPWFNVKEHLGEGTDLQNSTFEPKEYTNLLAKFSISDIKHILSQIDTELEQKMGYDYSNVLQIRTGDINNGEL